MDQNKYHDILRRLNDGTFKTDSDKVAYLDSVIETTDCDCNGFNDDLIKIRNQLNDKK